MEEGSNTNESRLAERDKLTPPPATRAAYVLNLIKDHNNEVTNWDLLCFCIEYLGSQVLIYEWLGMNAVRAITNRVYEAHYYREEVPETGVK